MNVSQFKIWAKGLVLTSDSTVGGLTHEETKLLLKEVMALEDSPAPAVEVVDHQKGASNGPEGKSPVSIPGSETNPLAKALAKAFAKAFDQFPPPGDKNTPPRIVPMELPKDTDPFSYPSLDNGDMQMKRVRVRLGSEQEADEFFENIQSEFNLKEVPSEDLGLPPGGSLFRVDSLEDFEEIMKKLKDREVKPKLH